METKPNFSIKQALSKGWQTYKANFGFLAVTFILYLLIYGLFSGVQSYFAKQESALAIILALISMYVSFLLQIGWVRIGLKLLNGESAEYEDLLKGHDRIVSYFLGNLLVGIIVCAGLILLIIPGFYWALKYMYVPYLIADRKLKVDDAMKLSATMTKGVKWHLISYGFVQLGLILLGTIALLIGLVIVLPTIWLASLAIYQQLDKSLYEQIDLSTNTTAQQTDQNQVLSENNQTLTQ